MAVSLVDSHPTNIFVTKISGFLLMRVNYRSCIDVPFHVTPLCFFLKTKLIFRDCKTAGLVTFDICSVFWCSVAHISKFIKQSQKQSSVLKLEHQQPHTHTHTRTHIQL